MTKRTSLAVLLAALVAACGGTAPASDGMVADESDLSSTNGLSTNGLSTNGLSTNGLSTNGLSTNGLSTNGLSTNGFNSWFAQDPSYSNMVMKYVARCALPAGQTLTYTRNGTTYSWPGNLGLVPGWSSGGLDTNGQQLISACLAAHTNKFGLEVPISVRAYDAWGGAVDVTPSEVSAYSSDEGCFYGNLFDGSGVYAAYSTTSPLADGRYTSQRACTMNDGDWGSCPPMNNAYSSVQQVCSGGSVANGYWSCVANGRSYRPVCVRLKPSQFNRCGDGICQSTETCYNRYTGSGCESDCGTCR